MFSMAVGNLVAVTTTSRNRTAAAAFDGAAASDWAPDSSDGGRSSASAGNNAAAYSSMAAWMRRMRTSFVWDRTSRGGDPVAGTTAAYGSFTRRTGTPRPLHATVSTPAGLLARGSSLGSAFSSPGGDNGDP